MTQQFHGLLARSWRRLRSRVMRALLGLTVRPSLSLDLVRLGSRYGGWWIPRTACTAESTCYLIGAGEDISFDLALVDAYACRVVTVDPTPRAKAYVDAKSCARVHFVPLGVAGSTGIRRFYAPKNPAHVSHSIMNLQRTATYFDAECVTLEELMSRLGDSRLDLLKLDVEGAEHEIIESLARGTLRPPTICFEIDQPVSLRRALASVSTLRSLGYGVAVIENFNVTCVLPDSLQ